MKKAPFLSLLTVVSLAWAQTAERTAQATPFFTLLDLATIAAMTLAAVGCAFAQSNAISRAMDGIARQPEAAGKIQALLLVGLGFIESLAIYVLVIALILIFANPAATAIAH